VTSYYTSSPSTSTNTVTSNAFQVTVVNCQPSIYGILSSYQYNVSVLANKKNVSVLNGSSYSNTTYPSSCSLTYKIYNLNGSTASNNSLIYFNQASGNLYIVSNSVFSLSLYIKVISTQSPSSSIVQSINFQIS